MSRKKKLLLNTAMGLITQVVVIICGFILPRYFMLYYGSAINGLVSSITHFLSFISLLDMGVGAVVQANLYRPLADKNNNQISCILKSSKRFFRRLAYIFLAYIGILCFIFPALVNLGTWYTVSLLLIIAVNTLTQYLFGITYQILLSADQKAYVHLAIQAGIITLNTMVAIILMRLRASVHLVKLATTAVYILRPLGQILYVHKHYRIDRKIKVEGEPIQQKWNGFSQHLAAVVCENIDVAVLTLFSTLENVSIYSIYFNVTSGVERIVMTAATGLESLFGNMIAKNEREQLLNFFSVVEWCAHTFVTIIFSIAMITIVPFVSVYTKGITDADYTKPLFAILLVTAYGMLCLRVPYFRVIKAAGHFKQTQNGAYISAGINIIVTVALFFKFDLVGVAIGTLLAMLYHTCYFVWYLQKNILVRPAKYFIKYLLTDAVVAIVSYTLSKTLVINSESYVEWVVLSAKVSVIVISISLAINLFFYSSQLKTIFGMLRRK